MHIHTLIKHSFKIIRCERMKHGGLGCAGNKHIYMNMVWKNYTTRDLVVQVMTQSHTRIVVRKNDSTRHLVVQVMNTISHT